MAPLVAEKVKSFEGYYYELMGAVDSNKLGLRAEPRLTRARIGNKQLAQACFFTLRAELERALIEPSLERLARCSVHLQP